MIPKVSNGIAHSSPFSYPQLPISSVWSISIESEQQLYPKFTMLYEQFKFSTSLRSKGAGNNS